jgi:L-iditol 2-dehydrogenase
MKAMMLTANPDSEDVVAKIFAEVPELLDVVFECCGQQDAIDNAVDLLKQHSTWWPDIRMGS